MQLRKLAATALGALMAGATIATPALAADLSELPAPFVENNNPNFTVVVGADAATADVVGAVDIAARFGGETVTAESAGAAENQEDIELSNALTNQFSTSLDDNDVASLQDTTISFDTESWDVHDEIHLGSSSPAMETSLTASETDYEDNVVMEVANKNSLQYFYVFEETINLSDRVASDNELEIEFLGNNLEITEIVDDDTLKAQAGQTVNLDAGESTTVEGSTVELVKTSSSKAVVEVDGESATISEGNSKTVGGLEVQVETVFNDDGVEFDSAELIVGDTAIETYDDGDEYIDFCTTNGADDCDDDSPDWVWALNDLNIDGKGQTDTDSTDNDGPTIAVTNDFVKDSDNTDPVQEGGAYWLPHENLKVEFTDLLEDDFLETQVEFDDSVDVDEADLAGTTFGTSEAGFLVTTGSEDGLKLDAEADGWKATDLSSDATTDQIFLEANSTGTAGPGSTAPEGPFVNVFYWDNDNNEQYAGNLTLNATAGNSLRRFAHFDFENTDSIDRVTIAVNSTDEHLNSEFEDSEYLVFDNNKSSTGGSDDLFVRMGTGGALDGTSGRNFDALGTTSESADGAELVWGANANDTNIGTRDENQRTAYGIGITNPDSEGESDRVTLNVPGDFQEARVTVGAADAGGATSNVQGQITTSVSKLDTEVSSPSAENNLVLVGGPCANTLVADLADQGDYPWTCDEAVSLGGSGYTIEMVEDAFADGQAALVVAGMSADDTRDASSRVQNFGTDGLTGMSVRTGVFQE